MSNDKEENKSELEIAAEVAYKNVVNHPGNNENDQEFDYDEQLFMNGTKNINDDAFRSLNEKNSDVEINDLPLEANLLKGNNGTVLIQINDGVETEDNACLLDGNNGTIMKQVDVDIETKALPPEAAILNINDETAVEEINCVPIEDSYINGESIKTNEKENVSLEKRTDLQNADSSGEKDNISMKCTAADVSDKELSSDVSQLDSGRLKSDHQVAIEEWEQVDEIVPHEAITGEPCKASSDPLSFAEAIDHFKSLNLTEYEHQIRPCVQRSGLASLFHTLTGPSVLLKALISERNFIFTLALMKFDNNDSICLRMLYTIYKQLMNVKLDCPRYGRHWESIGFQGNDPSTDLRGCGLLALFTTLHFISSSKTSLFASKVYNLSQDEHQHFPFCVMSINVTRMTLQILREGKLNKECNKKLKLSKQKNTQCGDSIGVVFGVFQQLYVAIFTRIYTIWKNDHKTMIDSGFVMGDVEALAKRKPLELMREEKKNSKKLPTVEKVEFKGVDEI